MSLETLCHGWAKKRVGHLTWLWWGSFDTDRKGSYVGHTPKTISCESMLKIVFYTEFSLEFGGGGTFISLWVFIPQILAGYKKNLAISPADNFQLPVRKCSNVWFEACTWTWCWWWVPQRSPPPPAPNRSGPPQPPQQPPSARGKTQQPVTGTTRAGLMCWVK